MQGARKVIFLDDNQIGKFFVILQFNGSECFKNGKMYLKIKYSTFMY